MVVSLLAGLRQPSLLTELKVHVVETVCLGKPNAGVVHFLTRTVSEYS